MIGIYTSYSSGLSALQLLKPVSAATRPTASEVDSSKSAKEPVNVLRYHLSSGIQNALFEINRVINTHSTKVAEKAASIYQQNDLNETVVLESGYLMGPKLSLSDLTDHEREAIRSMGIDPEYVRRISAPEISDDEFQKMTLDFMMNSRKDDPKFMSALENGTLKIQRARDVPELGLGHLSFSYKGALGLGSFGFGNGNFNKELYLEIQSQGIHQATGSINGQEFYVTWPDESLKA